MKLEEIGNNVVVNLDSETARRIADQYIQFKYFDSILGFVCFITFIAAFLYVAIRLIRDRE